METLDFDDDMAEDATADSGIDVAASQAAVLQLLEAVGEQPDREGLRDTPKRVARMYTELLSGYRAEPEKIVNGALFNITY
ncbi:MAG: GTP cyclohydrolase I, partial [Anaerolineae bacterium]